MTLAETIKDITRNHLENNNGLLFGQCVTAVGWVNGTVPDCKNIVELPMSDVAAAGFVVGAALVGRRPIFVLRFQDFFILNGSQILHYAALSKELHGAGVPLFLRCIGTDAAGPVHSVILHNIPMYFPGINVYAPMSPGEYRKTWEYYMENDLPVFVSEHRRLYTCSEEWTDKIQENADITLYAISDARVEMEGAAKILESNGIKVNTVHIFKLKPLETEDLAKPLAISKKGLVIDSGFPSCGAARSIAYELSEKSGHFVHAMSCEDKTKCFNPAGQNRTPNAEMIAARAMEIIGNI
jgi:pyruvate/2-oxoglutarate/acetoin dehydrogenase E1 component